MLKTFCAKSGLQICNYLFFKKCKLVKFATTYKYAGCEITEHLYIYIQNCALIKYTVQLLTSILHVTSLTVFELMSEKS